MMLPSLCSQMMIFSIFKNDKWIEHKMSVQWRHKWLILKQNLNYFRSLLFWRYIFELHTHLLFATKVKKALGSRRKNRMHIVKDRLHCEYFKLVTHTHTRVTTTSFAPRLRESCGKSVAMITKGPDYSIEHGENNLLKPRWRYSKLCASTAYKLK